jgi:hypothetical protein
VQPVKKLATTVTLETPEDGVAMSFNVAVSVDASPFFLQ